ncbi:APC amino acid permease [Dichomitus squalens]|uniref:APC amino acid permease n=1 Tax=Dichomitus squalens TaxID=114155 RepID=A0A4Q9NQW2_9APHY|nr:APC amino acid permease [Dichomitus squalens]TBU43137.1 APC amino acid permease [Dichomitus squalens]
MPAPNSPSMLKKDASAETRSIASTSDNSADDDNKLLEIGYVPSFKREFSNVATISFAFSIMGLCSSIATTFNTPLTLGGPTSVTWCWILGATMCFTLGSSIAEIVSAFPTCGGLYTASAQLVPRNQRAIVGWVVGWLNILGQIVGLSSTEFGLANMIWAAVVVGRGDTYEVTAGKSVGLFAGLLVLHGILNCLATRQLARLTSGFVFINLGATFIIIIVLLATTPRSEMHSASYVFGSDGFVNNTGGWNNGIAFLFGLLSVQWTDYDATAHISEEVRRAAYAAPSAIFIAVIGTGIFGWILNIVLVLCSGPLENLPGPSGSAFLEIMVLRMGKPGALFIWAFVCLTAFFVCQTALQAASRTVYAFSRDKGLPDRGFFGHVSTWTRTPLRAIWLVTVVAIVPGLLDLASDIALNAIFAMTAMALDLSYIIPIFCRRWYRNHPEVKFTPGPFYMGDGIIGWIANVNCILWTLFVCIIFALPTELPVNGNTMNYAAPITGGVILLSLIWYVLGGRKHYKGPQSNRTDLDTAAPDDVLVAPADREKAEMHQVV